MAKEALATTIVKTKNITEFEVTAILVNYEQDNTEIHYITYDDEGTPYQRGTIREDGTTILNNNSVLARVKDEIAAAG